VTPFSDLGDGDELVDVAVELSRLRQVLLTPSSPDGAARLLESGFVPVCGALHVVASDTTLSTHRSRRRQLRDQTTTIDRLGLVVSVLSGRRVAASRELFDSIYYGLVVPGVYARGITPHGVQHEATFRRLVERGLVVTASDAGGAVRCASLYDVRDGRLVTGAGLPEDRRALAVGLVEACDPALSRCRRAWRHRAVQELTRRAFDVVSIGAEDCMIDPGYVPVILDKLAWYRSVAWEQSRRPRFVSLGVSRHPDRFPIVVSVLSGRPRLAGRWDEHPARPLGERLRSLVPLDVIGEAHA